MASSTTQRRIFYAFAAVAGLWHFAPEIAGGVSSSTAKVIAEKLKLPNDQQAEMTERAWNKTVIWTMQNVTPWRAQVHRWL